jgi:hypothetical protein
MAGEHGLAFATGHRPEARGPVKRGRRQPAPIGGKRYSVDFLVVPLEYLLTLPRGDLPDACRVVVGGRGQVLAIRRKGERNEGSGVPGEDTLDTPPSQVKEINNPPFVGNSPITSRGQHLAIGRRGDGI